MLETTTNHSQRRPLAEIHAALLLLIVTGCGDGETKKTGEGALPLPDNTPTVIADPVERRYDSEFVEALGKLESPEPGDLPEVEPGKLVANLSSWSRELGEKVEYQARLDTSRQVFALSIPEDVEWNHRLDSRGEKVSPPLAASMAESGVSTKFRSASMLAFKAKQFDDGLYAAVELAADQGTGSFVSRRALLADLATALSAGGGGTGVYEALGLLGAATNLGGHAVDIPAAATSIAADLQKGFLGEPLRSKPIGFYTWSRELAGIFQRDRLLQTELESEVSTAIAGALGGDADLLARYRTALRLPQRLTNGFARDGLAAVAAGEAGAQDKLALFPASRAYETDLIKKLYGDQPIPDGFDLADEMVRRIRSGELNLQPGEDSGWYDYQTYALEPLVIPDKMPEAKHLQLDGSYKKELVKLFKALLALTRETHIKQLESPTVGAAAPPPGIVLHLRPRLSQEPLATFYLRRALAYRFVRGVLAESFGEAGLGEMNRLTAAGPVNLTLDRELRAMEALFYGAYLNTAHELGMTPEEQSDLGLGDAKSLALYRGWNPMKDPDVSRDVRMMVPVFYDIERRKTKVWVVLGVTTRPLNVRYATPPTLDSVVDTDGNPVDLAQVDLRFERAEFSLAYPVMAELYVTEILNREELRALCDQHQTREAILANLK